jgi:hypothetical protein
MVVHSSSGVTGALFFAAAPLISQQDAVLEAVAQQVLENIVTQFVSSQLPTLAQIAPKQLIKAKDGGRVSGERTHFTTLTAHHSVHRKTRSCTCLED